MKIAYFDCFSGISGDMILGALIDVGLDVGVLERELSKLGISEYELSVRKVKRQGLSCTKADVKVFRSTPLDWRDIKEIITRSSLSDEVKEVSINIFRKLIDAEAKVHDTREVHLHEIGALDTVVDVVGAVCGVKLLGIERVCASPLHIGRGMISSSHGKIPIPAPATCEILKGVPVYSTGVEAELVTPTGAAIITTLADGFGWMPQMTMEGVGYGAGEAQLSIPNALRIITGREELNYMEDTVILLETNIDDMNPQFYEYVIDRLLEVGALDVYLTPIQMKKSRPAVKLSVLSELGKEGEVASVLFRETTTLGIRVAKLLRKKLPREVRKIKTKYGEIKTKVARLRKEEKIVPEYEDCKKIAIKEGIPLQEVYSEVFKSCKLKGDKLGN